MTHLPICKLHNCTYKSYVGTRLKIKNHDNDIAKDNAVVVVAVAVAVDAEAQL